MRWLLLTVACVVLCFPSVAVTQTSPCDGGQSIVGVGVALPRNQSLVVFTPSWQRAQLVRAINQDGKGKKGAVSVKAIALEASSLADATDEAEKQKCGYFVLVTAVGPIDRIEDDNVSQVHPGEITSGSSLHMPDLQITFELFKVGSPAPLNEGMVVAHGTEYQGQPTQDWNDSVRQVMDSVAKRVIAEVRRQPVSAGD